MNALLFPSAPQAGTSFPLPPSKQRKFIPLVGRSPISTNLLFHIHGDEFGLHSELEGGSSLNAVFYLSDFLKDRQKRGLPLYGLNPSVLKELEGTIYLRHNNKEHCTNEIRRACRAHKPFLIAGGWAGIPSGHTIYYEYDPIKKTLRLYNLGAGVSNHLQAAFGRKIKFKPYCEWGGVSQEKLLDPDFLSCLWELEQYSYVPGQNQSTHYQAKDLYSSLKKWLGVSKKGGSENHLWKSQQRAGTCSWDSLLGWIYTKINNPEEYKHFINDIKMQSLIESIETPIDESKEEDVMRRSLINRSMNNFSRSLAKRAQSLDAAQTETLLFPVKKWIKVHSQGWEWVNHSSKPTKKPTLNNKVDLPPLSPSSLYHQMQANTLSAEPKSYFFVAHTSNKKPLAISEISSFLALVQQGCQAGQYQDVYTGLLDEITALPLDKVFWKGACGEDPEKAKQLIVALGEMAYFFFKSSYKISKATRIHADRPYILAKLLYIQEKLAHIAEPKWKEVFLSFDMFLPFCLIDPGLFFSLYDSKKRKDLDVLQTWAAETGRGRGPSMHADLEGPCGGGMRDLKYWSVTVTEPDAGEKNFPFYLAEEILPNLGPQIVDNFESLNPREKAAELYKSDRLPGWIKNIRNTHLYYIHSVHEPLETTNSDFSITFSPMRKDSSWTMIDIKISDIKWQEFSDCPQNMLGDKRKQIRFHRGHRPFASQEIRKLVLFFLGRIFPNKASCARLNEKTLLSLRAQDQGINLSNEEFKDLCHLFLSPSVQCVETLSYFIKHPEKLKDSDYQTLFELFLFQVGLLETEFSKSRFEEQLAAFLQQYVEKFALENDIQPCLALLKISRHLAELCPHNPFFQTSLERVRGLLKQQLDDQEDPSLRSLLYQEIAAHLSKKQELREEEVVELLLASAYVHEHPIPRKWLEPETEKEVREGLVRHAKTIEKVLRHHPDLLNQVFLTLRPQEKEQQKWKTKEKPGCFPIFETEEGKHLFFPLSGQCVSPQREVILPLDIQEHPSFRRLFPHVGNAIYHEGDLYSFEELGKKILVRLHNQELIIEQEREGEWFRFIPHTQFLMKEDQTVISSLTSRYLAERYSHWQSLHDETKLLLIDLKTKKACYKATVEQGNIEQVRDLSDGSTLKGPHIFWQFEDPAYIQVWREPIKIELPRFSLSFSLNAKGQWASHQYKGYVVSKKQRIPELGYYAHAIVLENEQGDRKVVIPNQKFMSSEQKEILLPRFEIDRQIDLAQGEDQECFVYDLPKKGKILMSSSLEANLYLSYVLNLCQSYRKGAFYLKRYGDKLGKYTDREIELLKTMIDTDSVTGDTSGNGWAFRAYAGALLFKDSLMKNALLEKETLTKIHQNFIGYFSHRSHVTELILEEKEVELLLKALEGRIEDLNALFLNESLSFQQVKGLDLESHLKNAIVLEQEEASFPDAQFASFLRTRPSGPIRKYLRVFIRWAQTGTKEQKAWLKISLCFLRDSFDLRDQTVATLLSLILEHPDVLPPFDSLSVEKWKEIAIKKMVEYMVHQKVVFSKKQFKIKPPIILPLPKKEEKIKDEPLPPISYSLTPPPPFTEYLEEKRCFNKSFDLELQAAASNLMTWLKPLRFSEPVEQKELQRLIDDLTFYSEQKPPTVFSLKENGLKDIEALITPSKKGHLEGLAQELVSSANHPFNSEEKRAQFNLEKWGGLRHKLTLDELIMNIGLKNQSALQKRNPALTLQDLQVLTQKIGRYLMLSTEEQKKERARVILAKIKEAPLGSLAYEDLVQQLAEQLYAERHYDVNAHPEFLVFEYYQNIWLREAQVEKNELFLNAEKVKQNPFAQMIMGSGKTTALPLIGLLRQAVMVVPEALFEDISLKTQKVLRETFGVKLRTLLFDRSTTFNLHSLKLILHDLDNIEKNGECLIMTSKSLQCLLLKFLERAAESGMKEEVLVMRDILLWLKKKGVHIDEVDTIARVIHMLCFDTQEKGHLTEDEIKIVAELYLLLYSDEEIKTMASLESDPVPHQNSTALTEEIYHKRIKQRLAEKFYDKLSEIPLSSSSKESIQKFVSDLSNKKLALAYLTRNEKTIELAQAFYNEQEEEVQEILALAGEEISTLLSHTLCKNHNENYGLDPHSPSQLAIPYSAANVPTSGSQFASQHVTMNYTVQSLIKQGISREILVNYIHDLQALAIKEMKEADEDLPLNRTEAWNTFRRLPATDQLFNLLDAKIDAILSAVNRSPSSKMLFISEVILPKLDIAIETWICNPHDLFLFSDELTGFSGTFWNSDSMNKKIKPKPEIGTDAKTLCILNEKSRYKVITLKETGSSKKMFDQLSRVADYDMLIDGGGYFKKESSEESARVLLEEGKPVVFYNKKGEPRLIKKENEAIQEIPLSDFKGKPEDRKTFLTQDKTIGVDVTQRRRAIGMATLKRDELLRDLLQHVWRLRQLDKLQQVYFVLSQEVEEVIREALEKPKGDLIFDDLFLFALKNQAREQGKDNAVAFRQELWGEVKKIVFDVLLNEKATAEECDAVLKKIQPLWLQRKPLTARALYGQIAKLKKSKGVVKTEVKRCREFVENLYQELPFLETLGIKQAKVLEEIDKTKVRMLSGLLHEKIPARESDADHTVEIQAQTQTQNQVQKMEMEEQHEEGDVTLGCIPSTVLQFYPQFNAEIFQDIKEKGSLPYFSLKCYCETDPELKEMADAFEGIHLTLNVLEWPQHQRSCSQAKLLGPNRTPLEFVLMREEGIVLLSQWEASKYKEMKEGRLYHLTLGYADGKKLDEATLAKAMKVNFLNGKSYYSREERVLLKAWIESQGKAKMQRFFEDKILRGFPSKRIAYQSSVLKKMLVY